MKRSLSLILSFGLGIIVAPVRAGSPTPAELSQAASWVAALQNADGGFASSPGGPSSLGATSAAVKVLKYTGGSVKDVPGASRFVQQCFDAESGGFAPTPGGKTDVGTTASGLMAAGELKTKTEAIVPKAIAFFHEHARTFPEIRIAVAGLEGVGAKSADFPSWTELVKSDRKPDGTWGEGAGRAFATGGAAVALLRMGADLDHREAILAAIREGQRSDGGWSDGDKPSDLGSSYRVMRCFFMMKEKPDLDRLFQFIARNRNSDGGYGPAPGKPSDLGSTYTATIMIHWARQLGGEPAIVETAGFQPLFNGKDLDGWEGDKAFWSARDGMIVGTSKGLDHNDFLATEKSYGDFVLKFSFRLRGSEQSNSGVQFRSVRIPGHEMSGYQADIGQGFWGCLYDESRRNRVMAQASQQAREAVRRDDWNHYVLRAMGDQISLQVNGVTSFTYREEDPKVARDGKIALQIHAGGPMTIEFKDFYIQELPRPVADDATTPGFHLRTVSTPDGPRKYTVFVPRGYDGTKRVPAVLFLHGSGERGEDGVRSAQVGLGAAIAQAPDTFPAIAVFPQARQTWAADSPDAAAALAALDDVMKAFQVDPARVALTGLSMGGRGSWELAAAHPERFSAVVPICGPGRVESAATLKGLPVWSVVGDADREATVQGLRAMFAAITDAGGSPRMTEYRGVGHNSWDRAYSDPSLVDWMLSQSRSR
jgi:pimeloyl-ACP methyl ester carboxylesterase